MKKRGFLQLAKVSRYVQLVISLSNIKIQKTFLTEKYTRSSSFIAGFLYSFWGKWIVILHLKCSIAACLLLLCWRLSLYPIWSWVFLQLYTTRIYATFSSFVTCYKNIFFTCSNFTRMKMKTFLFVDCPDHRKSAWNGIETSISIVVLLSSTRRK